MTTPHVSFRQISIYVALALAVPAVVFFTPDCDEAKAKVLFVAQNVVAETTSWLSESTSRFWLIASTIAFGGLLLYGYCSLRKQLNRLELRMQSIEFENPSSLRVSGSQTPIPAAAVQPSGPLVLGQNAAHGKANGTGVHQARQRVKADNIPEPAQQLAHIMKVSQRNKWLRVKPELPGGPWQVGSTCHKGRVRPENQDYALAFIIGGRQVLVVADGCGGIPYGGRAAYLAAVAAVDSIVNNYGKSTAWYSCGPQTVATQALQDASLRLAKEGVRLGLVNHQDGLRTTLIVVIADGADVGYAYCGDGGACIVRTTGDVERFLRPQKAGPDQPNVLTASLGPQMQGEPVLGTIHRNPGDLLLIGTDGVFDRVENSFPKDVLRAAIQFGGNLDQTANLIIEELISGQDEAGYICDDNATLVIAGDGAQPVLRAGFWNAFTVPSVKVLS